MEIYITNKIKVMLLRCPPTFVLAHVHLVFLLPLYNDELPKYAQSFNVLHAPRFCIHVNQATPHKDILIPPTFNDMLMNMFECFLVH
jgi:hypothetical protein